MDKELNNINKKRISPTVTAFIGALITMLGGFFLTYNYVQAKKIMAYDYMANAFYNGTEIVNISEEEATKKPVVEKTESTEVTNDYIGYLTIPKINLTKVCRRRSESPLNSVKSCCKAERHFKIRIAGRVRTS